MHTLLVKTIAALVTWLIPRPSIDIARRNDHDVLCLFSECKSGICVLSKCVLSDYASLTGGSRFGEYAIIWGFVEYDAASLLFLLMVSLVVAHQPSFGGAWLVAGLMVVFGGLVGIGDQGASLPALTAGFFLVISYGVGHIYGMFALAVVVAVFAIKANGSDRDLPPAAELLPVIVALMQVVMLTAHLTRPFLAKKCGKGAANVGGNWDRTSFAMGHIASATAAARKPRMISRAVSFCGWLGICSVVYLFFSDTRSSYIRGAMIDCSSFSLPELRGFMQSCSSIFVCHTYPPTTETCGGDATAADSVHTGMYALTDPLAWDFIWKFRVHTVGICLFAVGSILAVCAADPEVTHPTAAAPRKDTDMVKWKAFSWNKMGLFFGGLTTVAMLLMAFGAYGMFNLDVDDVLYGNSAGAPPHLGPLSHYVQSLTIVDPDEYSDATNPGLNNTLDSRSGGHAAAGSTSDGSACASALDCMSRICVPKDSTQPAGQVCVLQDFWPAHRTDAANWHRDATSAPYWHPIYSGLGMVASASLPIELSGPTLSYLSSSATVALGLHAWVMWSGALEGLDIPS